jgi:hypothetical protein
MHLTAYALKHMLLRMLTLLTTDEFADWFAALNDASAEEVASGLELMRELGPERAPPHTRDLVLWYQAFPDGPLGCRWLEGDFFNFSQRLRAFVSHLESAGVQRRLAEAPPEAQMRVSSALAEIRALAHPRHIYAALQREGAEKALANLQRHYHTILQAANVLPARKTAYTEALHELNFPSCQPALRVLYGVDVANDRALLVLGESLDRQAFGPAVRRALRVWNAFLSGESSDQPSALQPRQRQ